MSAHVVSRNGLTVTISMTFRVGSSMLEGEEEIQDALNATGIVATKELLKSFDSDGSPIVVRGEKLTSKGRLEKNYQTPYGVARVGRHVYQGSCGGATFCPLEEKARIVGSSTPRFAKQLSSKYSLMSVPQVQRDLSDNHGRDVNKVMIQSVSERVAAALEVKEEIWTYEDTACGKEVSSIGIGMDGTCINMLEDGWRQTMVGTIALFNDSGDRLHTNYIAAPPEYGMESFLERMEREIEVIANRYPEATRIGIADGAKCNWQFLSKYTEKQTLDFWHASEYVSKAAQAIFPKNQAQQQAWTRASCHKLKHNHTGPTMILNEMRSYGKTIKGAIARSKLASAISYFKNNRKKMTYASNLKSKLPIGSGITEAACKTIVKQRMCQSGMRWKDIGAQVVLQLRTAVQTAGKWSQFWDKVSQYGMPLTT